MAYDHIAEVVECRGRTQANLYLAAGYELLSVATVHYNHYNRRPVPGEPPPEDGPVGLRRGVSYVLGRPLGTDHYDPPEQHGGGR